MSNEFPSDQSDPAKKIGNSMWFLAWGAGLFLLYLFFSDKIEKQRNPNQNPESVSSETYTEVILKRNRQGHYVVSGTINRFPVVFLVDTGASGISIPEAVANQIGLRKGRQYSTYTANGIGVGYQTNIDSLSIGEIQLGPMPAGINPNMPSNQILLGMTVLKQLEFTQRGNLLILRQYH
ncbi:retropepsin-like aspartic protease family protein [Pleionea sediminis]|uniref:retropepsin-like aspartic protease family protein n=1 Tax=Pleionea sediminis TaxID=2569479 RepID=UPI001184D167|nr:TIGR02281 family clan AA aspartic protease [Pleionea sediminis]